MTVRITPEGVAYEATVETIGTDTVTMLVPLHVQDGTVITLVVAAHGLGGNHTHIDAPQFADFVNGCMARGWVIACPALHGDSWANSQAMSDLVSLHGWADTRWSVERVILHGGSAGAFTVASVVALDVLPDVVGTITIDGVLNPELFWVTNTLARNTMNAAWGTTTRAEFSAAISGQDPAKSPVGLWRGTWFMASSPADSTVAQDINTQMFVGRMTDPEHDITYTETSGGHMVEANFLNAQALAWMDGLAPVYSGGAPGDPEDPPPPSSSSSNLRDTSGNPVALLRTDGTPVALSPA